MDLAGDLVRVSGESRPSVATTRELLSLVAALGQLYPVVVAFLAFAILHERISRPQLVGVGAAVAGVVFIAAG